MRIEPGTRAIVTGASRGIGRALCVSLASRGARLGLVARDRERLEEVVERLPESPAGPHLALAADVSKRSQVQRAVDRFAKRAEGLDLVVANAGIAHYGPFADTEIERAEEMVRMNVLGTIYTVGAGAPAHARPGPWPRRDRVLRRRAFAPSRGPRSTAPRRQPTAGSPRPCGTSCRAPASR